MIVLPTVGVQTRGPPGNPGPNFPRSQTRIPMLTQPSEIRKWGVGVRVSGSRDLSGGEGLGGSPQELAVRGCAVFSHLHFSISGHHPYPPEFRNQEKTWQKEKPSVPLEAEPVLWCPSRVSVQPLHMCRLGLGHPPWSPRKWPPFGTAAPSGPQCRELYS